MSEYYCFKCGAVTKKKKKDGTKICAVCRSQDEITAQTTKQNQEKIEELILETNAGFSQQERELKAQKRDINALQANVDRQHREINSTKYQCVTRRNTSLLSMAN